MQNTIQTQPETLSKLQRLEAHLRERIRGQNHVLPRIVSVLQRGELGITKPERPKGSFLLLGPTGVGKTEVTLAFTSFLLSAQHVFRFDMSEYQTQERLPLLLGTSATERGMLAMVYERSRVGTLLFDEIEKAHPLVLDLFLQMLDDASITFASGERKNLGQFYIVFTSNIGSGEVMRMTSAPMATVERTVLSRVGQQLRPELVGRITEKLVFGRLDFDTQREICELMIGRERTRLGGLGFNFEMSDGVVEFLIRKGYHKSLGARPMRSVVERHLQDAIARRLLSCESGSGRLVVDCGTETLVLQA